MANKNASPAPVGLESLWTTVEKIKFVLAHDEVNGANDSGSLFFRAEI
jgi:hypothetical protein